MKLEKKRDKCWLQMQQTIKLLEEATFYEIPLYLIRIKNYWNKLESLYGTLEKQRNLV